MELQNIKMNIDTKLVLNIGWPMQNSNAPIAYNSLFAAKDMNCLMLPLEVPKGKLPELLKACKAMNVHYLCPTMPHKSDIIPYLDDVDEQSRIFNSVNAVKIDADGTSHGIGMDGRGTVNALLESGVQIKDTTVLLLGAGAISGVICLELARQGAKAVNIVNRTREKAQRIADKVNCHTKMRAAAYAATPENLKKCAAVADIVVQATPQGMRGYGADYEDLSFIAELPKTAAVIDCVLTPPCTRFRKAAMDRGLKTVPGMQMLVSQLGEIFDYLWDVRLEESDKIACMKALCTHLGVEYSV